MRIRIVATLFLAVVLVAGGPVARAAPVRDGGVRQQATQPPGAWGGRFTGSQGTSFELYRSDRYPHDRGWLQWWANWIDTRLYHGAELARLMVVFVAPDELAASCGPRADGCYDGERMVCRPRTRLTDGRWSPCSRTSTATTSR